MSREPSDPVILAAKLVAGLEVPKAPASLSEPHARPSLGATQALPQGPSPTLVLADIDAETPEEAYFRFDAVYSLRPRALGAAGLGTARPQALLKRSRNIGGPVAPWMGASNPRPAPLGPFAGPPWPAHTAVGLLSAGPIKGRRSSRRGAAAGKVGGAGTVKLKSENVGRGKRRAAQRQTLTVVALLEGPEEALPAATPGAAITAAEILAGLRGVEGGGHEARAALPPTAANCLPPSVAVADAASGIETPSKGGKRGRIGSRSVSPEQILGGAAGARAGHQPTKRQKSAVTMPFALVPPLVVEPKVPLLTA